MGGRTRSERGVALINMHSLVWWVQSDNRLHAWARKDSIQSQNVPEQQSGMVKGLACETRLKVKPNAKWK